MRPYGRECIYESLLRISSHSPLTTCDAKNKKIILNPCHPFLLFQRIFNGLHSPPQGSFIDSEGHSAGGLTEATPNHSDQSRIVANTSFQNLFIDSGEVKGLSYASSNKRVGHEACGTRNVWDTNRVGHETCGTRTVWDT